MLALRSPLLVPLLLALLSSGAAADVTLPAILSDHMILQKAAKVPIWGKADPGEAVTVTLNQSTQQTATATTDGNGRWSLALDLHDAAQGPFEMVVQGKNRLVVSDILVGEVWVASGQSNMERPLKLTNDAEAEAAKPADPLFRQFTVERSAKLQPQDDCVGKWVVSGPDTTLEFTAVGHYFAKRLRAELGVPVGIVGCYWGGTPAEAWTSSEALDTDPDLKAGKEKIWDDVVHYPDQKKAWAAAFADWMEKNGRADKPGADSRPVAPDLGADGWVPVKLPGIVTVPGLPVNGAIWFRKTFSLPAIDAGKIVHLQFSAIEGFESVYWNGHFLKGTAPKFYPGTGYARYCEVPAELAKEGPNVLSVRVFAPALPVKFPYDIKANSQLLNGMWEAKAEFELPPLAPDALAAVPKPPDFLLPMSNVACTLYNGMLHPILPYGMRGVIWYQGENNAGRAFQYRTAFPLMISDWRARWGEGDFPFYFCQLTSCKAKRPDPAESAWAELREAQAMTLKLPHTGQAVLIDIGEADDIHPRDKKDVGERLARIALAKDYGHPMPFSGPVFKAMTVADGKARLDFDPGADALVAKPLGPTYLLKTETNQTAPLVRNSPGSELEGFSICGADHKWVWADAKIEGNQVVVSSPQVASPVAVRYAWADNPTANLFNSAGLPASPFRTDDFPATTLNKKYPK